MTTPPEPSSTGSTYGRCPIPGASPATLELRAWHNFTGPERDLVDALGGTPRAGVQLDHPCGSSISLPDVTNWTYVQQRVAEHFGPTVNPDDDEHRRRELRVALLGAASADNRLAPPEIRQHLVDRLAPMVGRREADAAAAGLEAIRTQLSHHASADTDPCKARDVAHPCDVARALWPDAGQFHTAPEPT